MHSTIISVSFPHSLPLSPNGTFFCLNLEYLVPPPQLRFTLSTAPTHEASACPATVWLFSFPLVSFSTPSHPSESSLEDNKGPGWDTCSVSEKNTHLHYQVHPYWRNLPFLFALAPVTHFTLPFPLLLPLHYNHYLFLFFNSRKEWSL